MNKAQIDEIDKLLDVIERPLRAKDQEPVHWETAKHEALAQLRRFGRVS